MRSLIRTGTTTRRQAIQGIGGLALSLGLAPLAQACGSPEEEGYDEVERFVAAPDDEPHTVHGAILRRYGRFSAVPMHVDLDGDPATPARIGGRPVSGLLVFSVERLDGDPGDPHAYEVHYVRSDGGRVWLPIAWHLQTVVAGETYAILRQRKPLDVPTPRQLYAEDAAIIAAEDAWGLG